MTYIRATLGAKKKGKRDLAIINDYVDAALKKFGEYIDRSKKRSIVKVCKSNNIRKILSKISKS